MDFRKILAKHKSIDIETALPYGLIFVSEEGIIQWVNTKFIEYIGSDKDVILATDFGAIFESGLDAVVKSANSAKEEYIRHEESGDNYVIMANATCGGYAVDIRKLDERVITVPTKEETAVSRNKNNLIVKLASDIKAPIQSIIGFSQALIDGLGGELSEKQEKYTNIIYKNSNELLYLTEKLSELSKTELGIIEKDYKVLDIVNLIMNITRFTEQLYKDRNLSINFEADATIKKTFWADENGIKLAVQNILDTVVRYMELGDITVSLNVAPTSVLEAAGMENAVIISVICSGFSITEAELKAMFDPYMMIEGGLKRYVARSMAMTSVKNIVEAMSGKIWVTSEMLKNTTFNILIPIQERE